MTAGSLGLLDCTFAWRGLHDLAPLKTPALKVVAEAHERNLKRVYQLTVLPAVLINAVSKSEQAAARARFEICEEIKASRATAEKIRARINEETEKDVSARELIIKAGGKEASELLQGEIKFGFSVFEHLTSKHLTAGIDAYLSAQITGSWTAFEVLAEELWRTALNVHPHGLAELQNRKSSEDRSIPLLLLQKYSYDLSKSMGDLLKEKYNFDKLEEIRRAYSEAFSKDGGPTAKILFDKALDALSLVRHLILHSGGVVDEKYLRRKADLPASAVAPIGTPLVLSGKLTGELVGPVLNLSYRLIESVDDWLVAH